ncbi:MAG: DNA adenine methylase [Campylobacterota bacterium]|nr:DNA adenine methylase [Campylobacterota bacterium]
MSISQEKNNNIKTDRLTPILKWAGGKEQELKHIHPVMPKKINNFYEPFIGGGAVYFSMDSTKMFINDKSHELINLYNAIAGEDKKFFDVIDEMIGNWKILEEILENNKKIFIDNYKGYSSGSYDENRIKDNIYEFVLNHGNEFDSMFSTSFNINIENFVHEIRKNILNKIKRMKKIELDRGKLPDNDILDNMESALKSAFYMHFRHLYNNIQKYEINDSFATAIFFFIRNYAYSGMFRYNKSGGFNVPYGGIGYNRKNLSKKVEYLKSKELVNHLSKTTIDNLDFEQFFIKNKPKKDDFIFLDPPYDSEFSTYAQNEFTRDDQTRLANYLIDNCKANWMMVIKHTDFIYHLYNKPNINIGTFSKKYLVNFQNRNDKKVEHLVITNY